MAPARTPRGMRLGERGGVCPYSDEFSDEVCGSEADHWSAAINRYVCGPHYELIRQQFLAAASVVADTCPECGEERADCTCAAGLRGGETLRL